MIWNHFRYYWPLWEEPCGHRRVSLAKDQWYRVLIISLRPRQDGRHFADDIFMCIFFNENCCILIKFSLKYVRKGPIDNNPALVEIMAWRRSGDKPLSQPMMISLPTDICVARLQCVNLNKLSSKQSRCGNFNRRNAHVTSLHQSHCWLVRSMCGSKRK